jgi:pyruvate kinase
VKGVTGYQIGAEHEDSDDICDIMMEAAKQSKVCKSGDRVIVLMGQNEENPDETTVMRIMSVE